MKGLVRFQFLVDPRPRGGKGGGEMSWKKPRPEGFDYTKPDLENERCSMCNPDGFNRTGLKPIKFIGATTTGAYAVRCPNGCKDGLIVKEGEWICENQLESVLTAAKAMVEAIREGGGIVADINAETGKPDVYLTADFIVKLDALSRAVEGVKK
jgi:hypothetical protein